MKKIFKSPQIFNLLFNFSAEKIVVRGCLSDSTNESKICKDYEIFDHDVCIKCSVTGCNKHSTYRQPTLSCVKCSDSEECAFGENLSKSSECIKNVSLNDKESCYTRAIGKTIFLKLPL